jgi:tetratricopeptide (TPR) repeat protein
VGFQRHRDYNYYFYVCDPIDHLAELGWYHYRQGQPAETVAYYERVFAQREENPDYYYHLAAVAAAETGRGEQALGYLHQALDRGWPHPAHTRDHKAFQGLHGTPGWRAVLARLESDTEKQDVSDSDC